MQLLFIATIHVLNVLQLVFCINNSLFNCLEKNRKSQKCHSLNNGKRLYKCSRRNKIILFIRDNQTNFFILYNNSVELLLKSLIKTGICKSLQIHTTTQSIILLNFDFLTKTEAKNVLKPINRGKDQFVMFCSIMSHASHNLLTSNQVALLVLGTRFDNASKHFAKKLSCVRV